jgi:hypothetical protein
MIDAGTLRDIGVILRRVKARRGTWEEVMDLLGVDKAEVRGRVI